MPRLSAPFAGACLGVLVATGWVVWQRLRPPPCTGGLFVELRPPLPMPGPYHVRFELDDERCEFDVALPIAGTVEKRACPKPLELETRVQDGRTSLIGVAVGAAPAHVRFVVQRGGDVLYDTALDPTYSPYAVRREDQKKFCGDRAFLKPECRPGSPGCVPYPAACDGPEDCSAGKSCCLSPEQGKEYGAAVATECVSRRRCLDSFGSLACHGDAECPADMACSDRSLEKYYRTPVLACQNRR